MQNFGPTNPQGSAFAPKQWLYQKEATGMESPKLYCPSRCRYRTYHCVEAKYTVSWWVVKCPEWKYAKFRPYKSPWYRVYTKAMVISKGSYGHGESKNGNKRNFGSTNPHGTAFAPKQWLHQKEATGMESQKCIAVVGADTVLTTAWKQITPLHGG